MTSESVHLVGHEHLPPVLKLFADPSYKYSKHKHSIETSDDKIHHTYTIIVSQEPLNHPIDLSNLPTPHSDIMSQISSKSVSDKGRVVPAQQKKEQSCIEINGYSYLNAIPSVKSTRTGKFVTMVNVKFILFHFDSCKRRVQSTFTDEFQSDTPLADVVLNFQQMSSRQLRGQPFQPRMSYCIGELSKINSKPVMRSDLEKSLAQLAMSSAVIQFALIADNIGE